MKEEPVFEAETEYSEEEESDAFYGRFNQRGYNSGYRGRGRNRGRGDQRHNWRDKRYALRMMVKEKGRMIVKANMRRMKQKLTILLAVMVW